MSGDSGVRKILPQSTQMQTFSLTPNNFAPRENQKNYVFVDEHNRHKRLKVMRACEGCRRRKIKCDAATTNTWPCSACIRLKLHCVPPTVNYDAANATSFESDRAEYESGSGDDEYLNQIPLSQHMPEVHKGSNQVYQQQFQYTDSVDVYDPLSYGQQHPQQQTLQFSNIPVHDGPLGSHYPGQHVFPVAPSDHHHSQSPESFDQDQYVQQDLSDLLGLLKMDENGSAPYLASKKSVAVIEEPAFEDPDDFKNALPLLSSGPDMKIRIPPELMPDEVTALHYLDVYFDNVHPYVPVLNKFFFYRQWHTNRDAISPLILEGIFAIAGRLTDDPSQGQQWLALAGKHADSFMDVPRLSTLQGLLILLKARESAPKKGYYYRSWMTVVQCVTMGKDLGLDDHYEDHKSGKSCGSSPSDCITKTRIWQTIFAVELMVGSPQGRKDLSVRMDSLDLSIQRAIPGEESEYLVSRSFTYFIRKVCTIREMNNIYSRFGKKKEWTMGPEVQALSPAFEEWFNNLPSDLQISFPHDNSPPWLPSHFIGNLHSYYYLSLIMFHRPQLAFMQPSGVDGLWKKHMLVCYNSAKLLCRVQEAIINSFGLPGLLCMQRGINYTIYCVMTCTVLHLVAITSPDPDLNSDAREYFTRHMRLLEKCTSSWPMPDMQAQIDSLREAFSADVTKPFVLKPSFPYGSPISAASASPPPSVAYQTQIHRSSPMEHQQIEQHLVHQQVTYTSHPINQPISTDGLSSKSDSPALQPLVMMPTGQHVSHQPMNNAIQLVDPSQWNPAPIFDHWNTSFGTPSSTQSTPQNHPSAPLVPVSSAQELSVLQDIASGANLSIPPSSQPIIPQQYSAAPIPSYVSPSMWQQSVASVYQGGSKRQWDYDGIDVHGLSNKRR